MIKLWSRLGSFLRGLVRTGRPRPGAHFHGASNSRLFYDWALRPLAPDVEISAALGELRARARDLVRNNPYATGIVEAFADNVIGWDPGIRLKARVRGPDGKPAADINRELERGFKAWGHEENASADGIDSWTDLQRLLITTWVTDGEVFVRQLRGFDNPYSYALEFLDADLLDHRFNVPADSNGVDIRMGVERDRYGRPLAYWFYKQHPSNRGDRSKVRIPAEDILHFFVRYRAGQTRGFSLFAPVLTTVKMVDGLTEAELVASRMAAAKMGFITNNEPDAVAAYARRVEIMTDNLEEGLGSEARLMDLAPGVIDELLPGQKFDGFDPTHPNSAFEPFLKVMLRGVARGFSMSYLTLTGDVAEANFSSMRAGLLPERDHWRVVQLRTAGRFHRKVYRGVLAGGLLTGAFRLPTAVAADYMEHEWRPRGWKWVDPVKDLLALEAAIALGVDSRQHGAAEAGRDYETVIEEIEEELRFAEEHGVDVSGMKAGSGTSEPKEEGDGTGASGNGNRAGLLSPELRSRLLQAIAEEEHE